MSKQNYFLRPKSYYTRNINPITHYIQQTALYLSKMTGDHYNTTFDYVKRLVTENKLPHARNPTVKYYERDRTGDRSEQVISLSDYIRTLVENDFILAPTFTCYTNPKHNPSKFVKFTEENVRIRSIAKKEGFAAKSKGDIETFIDKNNEQANRKTYNNSLSGTFGTTSSVFFNPTAHSTLTSTIRCVSSFGNASNERVVMGNRHYYNPEIVLYNLIHSCQMANIDEVSSAIAEHQLHIPTYEEVLEVIHHSSCFYWTDKIADEKLLAFIRTMSPYERAAFCYSGDLYHLRKFNPNWMRTFIEELSLKVYSPIENPIEIIEEVGEDIINYVHQICFDSVKGLGKNYKDMPLEVTQTIAATGLNVRNVLAKYQSLISAFFLTKLSPSTHAYIQDMMRRSVVLSDTDSTCFSVDDWTIWYFGEMNVSERAYAVSGAVAFIASQCVSHLLALLSANINVIPEKLHGLAMKNEFLWPVHMPTNVAKHYAAWTVMQEGSVFKEAELEIKGVHMKNSAAPPELIKRAHGMISEILQTVIDNKKISVLKYINEIKDIEKSIVQSILDGSSVYLKSSSIKEETGYTKGKDESPYQHYQFWVEVFEPKYGVIDPPPFSTVLIPTELGSKQQIKEWLQRLEDQDFAKRLETYLTRRNKTSLNTFHVPRNFIQSYGLPVEIKQAVNVKKIALDLTLVFRIVLEALGIFIKDDWLVSEYFT